MIWVWWTCWCTRLYSYSIQLGVTFGQIKTNIRAVCSSGTERQSVRILIMGADKKYAAGTVLAPLGLILLIYVVLLVPSLVQRQQQQLVHTPHQAAQRHVRQLGSRAGQLSTLQVIF